MNHQAGKPFKIKEPIDRGANGIDLSGTLIIMDSIAIKNSPLMQIMQTACRFCHASTRPDYLPEC